MGQAVNITELDARFVGTGGPGVTNADGSLPPRREGVGVVMRCPCGACGEDRMLFVGFENPIDGGPAVDDRTPKWKREGDSVETLTLSPSIHRQSGCGWHGFIRNGEVVHV